MPRVGFEPRIPASKRAKTVHVLDHSAGMTVGKWNGQVVEEDNIENLFFMPCLHDVHKMVAQTHVHGTHIKQIRHIGNTGHTSTCLPGSRLANLNLRTDGWILAIYFRESYDILSFCCSIFLQWVLALIRMVEETLQSPPKTSNDSYNKNQ
jgi:hypothetical protein